MVIRLDQVERGSGEGGGCKVIELKKVASDGERPHSTRPCPYVSRSASALRGPITRVAAHMPPPTSLPASRSHEHLRVIRSSFCRSVGLYVGRCVGR